MDFLNNPILWMLAPTALFPGIIFSIHMREDSRKAKQIERVVYTWLYLVVPVSFVLAFYVISREQIPAYNAINATNISP